MVNPVKAVGEYKGADFLSYLEKLQIYDIFECLFQAYPNDIPLVQGIVKYIVYAYSLDSEHVIIRADWGTTKKSIFEYVMLPHGLYGDIVLLESAAVAQAISNWLDSQDNAVYTELKKLKDLKRQYLDSLSKPVLDVSYDQKFTNAKNSQQLTVMIKELENELIQNSDKLKAAAAEVRSFRKKNVVGPEKFAKYERQEDNSNWGTYVPNSRTNKEQ